MMSTPAGTDGGPYLMLPERFGRYEVLAELGDGAMGRVYTAWDPRVSRTVAIKTVKLESLSPQMADEFLQRFRREAQAAGGLNHPNIVRIFDVGDDHLVMEHVEGQTLQEKIRQEGRIEPAPALTLLAPIAEALDHAHAAGIIHRDIKPANIMIQPDGQPKLMDFGVAYVDDSVMTATGQIIGSPSYMSPEQVAGLQLTPRSDVYSLAVVAYEMLTGQSPFQARTITAVIYRVMHDDPPPPRRWNATLPTRYDEVFAKALAKSPEERFATATELAGALELRELELNLTALAGDDATAAAGAPLEGGGTTWVTVNEPPPPAPDPGPSRPAAPGPERRVRPWIPVAGMAAIALTALVASLCVHRAADAPEGGMVPGPSEIVASPVGPVPAPTATPEKPTTPAAKSAAPKATAAAPEVEATPEPTPAVVEGQLVELGTGVTPPRRVSGTSAPYPAMARRLRLAGTVTVTMIVTEDGEPLDPTVVESAGDILDQAVLDAIGEWRFEPARKDGVRVRVPWTVRQTFRLSR